MTFFQNLGKHIDTFINQVKQIYNKNVIRSEPSPLPNRLDGNFSTGDMETIYNFLRNRLRDEPNRFSIELQKRRGREGLYRNVLPLDMMYIMDRNQLENYIDELERWSYSFSYDDEYNIYFQRLNIHIH